MLNILLVGCCGKMGRTVTETVFGRDDAAICAGVDVIERDDLGYPVYTDISAVSEPADVIIDFSAPASLDAVLAFAVEKQLPCVFCATGYSDAQAEQIKAASDKTAVFRSGNMSLGINTLIKLSKAAAEILGSDFDIEIVEAHHNKKVDAPSGTALMLEKAVEDGLDAKPVMVFDRHNVRHAREKNEIGMHSVRGGTIVGEHEVIFAGNDEIVKLSHVALSKKIFADGAVTAAFYMKDKKSGFYDMSDVLNG